MSVGYGIEFFTPHITGIVNRAGEKIGNLNERNVLYLDKKKIAVLKTSGGLQSPRVILSGGKSKVAIEADIVKPVFESAGF